MTAFVPLPLDEGKMAGALPALLSRRLCRPFAATEHSARTTVRTITRAEVVRVGGNTTDH